MTPKEKAAELVHRFRRYVDFTDENDHTSLKAIISNSKQCALIAVDEIMKTYPSKNGIALYENQINDFEYWQQVKTEIENL
jgi:hypothetical protein